MSSGNFLPTFWDNLSVKDGINRLSLNVGEKLPLLAV